MSPRRSSGWLLALCIVAACGKGGGAGELGPRCEQLAKKCGDNDKHVAAITEGCAEEASTQVQKKCTPQVMALYDCYEKDLCGKSDRVWAVADLAVLADRKKICTA